MHVNSLTLRLWTVDIKQAINILSALHLHVIFQNSKTTTYELASYTLKMPDPYLVYMVLQTN